VPWGAECAERRRMCQAAPNVPSGAECAKRRRICRAAAMPLRRLVAHAVLHPCRIDAERYHACVFSHGPTGDAMRAFHRMGVQRRCQTGGGHIARSSSEMPRGRYIA